MKKFFHSWRRKAGVVALGLACAVMGMWLRSRVVEDSAFILIGTKGYSIRSGLSQVAWRSFDNERGDTSFGWHSSRRSAEGTLTEQFDGQEWMSPYWGLASPLTVLSAYLILWKPRKRA